MLQVTAPLPDLGSGVSLCRQELATEIEKRARQVTLEVTRGRAQAPPFRAG